MSKGARDPKAGHGRSQRSGQSAMQAQVGEVLIGSSEDEIEVRLLQVCRQLAGYPALYVPMATKPVDIAWQPTALCAYARCRRMGCWT
jgi:hypothetical protein